MSYGSLSAKQAAVVAGYVRGRVVHDLGAGNLLLSQELVQLGARKVVAVDCEPPQVSRKPKVQYVQSSFKEYLKKSPDLDIAFVSWPSQYSTAGLSGLCQLARRVIYVGCNDNETVCGSSRLFWTLSGRKVLRSLPSPHNDLLIYGDSCSPRKLTPHEDRALQHLGWLDDDEGQARAKLSLFLFALRGG